MDGRRRQVAAKIAQYVAGALRRARPARRTPPSRYLPRLRVRAARPWHRRRHRARRRRHPSAWTCRCPPARARGCCGSAPTTAASGGSAVRRAMVARFRQATACAAPHGLAEIEADYRPWGPHARRGLAPSSTRRRSRSRLARVARCHVRRLQHLRRAFDLARLLAGARAPNRRFQTSRSASTKIDQLYERRAPRQRPACASTSGGR